MTDFVLVEFIEHFAILNNKFVALEKALKGISFFKEVTKHSGIYYANRVENKTPRVSMGLDAELKIPYEKGEFSLNPLYSIGISFDVWKQDAVWKFNGDVGMSRLNGFDNTDSFEKIYLDIELLLNELENLVDNMIDEYNKLITLIC